MGSNYKTDLQRNAGPVLLVGVSRVKLVATLLTANEGMAPALGHGVGAIFFDTAAAADVRITNAEENKCRYLLEPILA